MSLLDVIIWLSISEKHNSLTKFVYVYEEIRRERIKEGEENFILKGGLGISSRGIYIFKKFIMGVDIKEV